jgi:alkylated DNA nucleotide flippase Atl1
VSSAICFAFDFLPLEWPMAAKFSSRTPWRVKLEKPNASLPKIVRVPPKWRKRFGAGTMAIAHPLHVDALVRTVKKGRVVTQTQLRERLARKYRAGTTCPLTTGIFLRIVSEVAEEDRRAGKKNIAPYWRAVRDDGSLNEKYPGGTTVQAQRLRAEGIPMATGKGAKSPKVRDLERHLGRL